MVGDIEKLDCIAYYAGPFIFTLALRYEAEVLRLAEGNKVVAIAQFSRKDHQLLGHCRQLMLEGRMLTLSKIKSAIVRSLCLLLLDIQIADFSAPVS